MSATDMMNHAVPAGDAPVLSVTGLTTAFKRDGQWCEVVRNVSFDVMPGETVAIVGESGSGKSVTSLSIMQLLAAGSSRISGSVRLNGQELLSLPPRQMRRVRGNDVAMIFQEPMTSLNPLYTVGWQLVEALQAHRPLSKREARDQAIALLEKVRIPNAATRFDEFPHRLSGGMRQRVMIAMALASRPMLLIADEPTTALDVTIQGQILELIKTLQEEEGTSVLFITHDMGVVAEIADRTVVMYQGEVVESGGTGQIFARPQKPYTTALLASVPMLGTMGGHNLPLRFAVADKTTGAVVEPAASVDTVVHAAPPILDVSGLTNRFDITGGLFGRLTGRVHAVENVSFSLQPGETLSLVGESGCGKSTTGRSILRLVEPAAGQIRLDGTDVMTLSPAGLARARRDMQMIFQDPYASLNPRMTVAEAIAEPYLEHRLGTDTQAKARVQELLELVGLPATAMSRYPHEFSGGQRQRICIARALVMDPKVIVADESVSALDGSVKGQVINLLLDLQERLGLSYLFISHDMAVVERVSHRVAVMYLGEIVEIGPRAQIFGAPQHPYTRRLIDAVPVPDPARRRQRRGLSNEEIPSPIRAPDYRPLARAYREVSSGHLVMQAD
jgi:peptide/nickel transport system ATP-binding protein